jgi:type II secretory pathway pseudopilin PulG
MKAIITDKKLGFTLIELILYIALVGLIFTGTIQLVWEMVGGGVKNSYEAELNGQMRFVSEKIKREIRSATGINTFTSTSISLAKAISGENPTVIDLSAGQIRIKYGVGAITPITTNLISVTNLTFTNYTSPGNTSMNIGFDITAAKTSSSNNARYQTTPIIIHSDAEVRSN